MEQIICTRQANPSDCSTIAELGRQTFAETYGDVSNKESIERYLAAKFSTETIAAELASPGDRFYIANFKSNPVGFTKLKNDREAKGLHGRKTIEVERIYVLPEYQRSKVGSELMRQCKEIARAEKFETIWLQVWQQNLKAIQFYQKAGFVIYETTHFSFDDITHQDFLMRYDLYY
jgi:ribosomal protein S18 acetylase RimI-like enzyme